MALGAQTHAVRRLILGQTLKLTYIGVIVGLVGSYCLAQFLASLLFGVGMHDLLTFLGAQFC